MKLRNMWMGLSCITCVLISLSCPHVKGTQGEYTPHHKITLEQQEQAKVVAANFISGVFKNYDPKKAIYKAAFVNAFLKNISHNVIKKDISAESITTALGKSVAVGAGGCLYQFLTKNDPTGNIIANTIQANLNAADAPAAAPVRPVVVPGGPPIADHFPEVEGKSKEEMTDFFDKMIKAGIANNCFK